MITPGASSVGGLPSPNLDDVVDPIEQARVFEALFQVPAPTHRIGRYVVLGKLGSGGMGTVLEAFDRALDRRVALKVLHRDLGARQQRRLEREAQALAKLSHPNVVQIYEVGESDGRAFIAMELVQGCSLREWMAQQPRPSWQDCVASYRQAGEGLAAAHAQGLIHRDFKPDNALIGDDGRVRVADFGLARSNRIASAEDSSQTASTEDASRTTTGSKHQHGSDRSDHETATPLTKAGAILGTIAYMAPEQMAGHPVDARADQFSFCAALFEAVYGERPFDASTIAARILALYVGLTEPKSIASAPRWLFRALSRGLSIDPAQRFESMDALLRELSRARGRGWKVGSATAGLVLGGVGMSTMLFSAEVPCELADAELAARWNDEARARVLEGFVGAAPSYGSDAARRTTEAIDARVDAWRVEQRDACEDTRLRGTHTEDLLAQRTACIDRNTASLRALLDALDRADADLVSHALELVEALPEPVRCQNLDALGPEAPEDPEAVQSVRDGIAQAEVARQAGSSDQALAMANELRARAEATGYGPVRAEALVESARARWNDARPDERERGVEMLWEALDLAELHGHDELLFEIWIELVTVDQHFGRHAQASRWARRAEVALERSPGAPRRRLELALRRGVSALDAGDIQASARWLREGLDDAASQSGSELMQAQLYEALGNTLRRAARREEALEAYAKVEQLWRDRLGPEHPYLARHDFNVGLLLVELGRTDAARERLLRARAHWVALDGEESSRVGRTELVLARLALGTGALDDALEHTTRGRDILAVALAPDDAAHNDALKMLGLVQFYRGDLQAAYDAWQEVLERLLAVHPPEHLDVVETRSNMAEALVGLGRYERAQAIYAELLPMVRARANEDPQTLMLVLKGLGQAELGSGNPAAALPHLHTALELLERLHRPAGERAELQWALARAEWETGRPRAMARARAEQAAELFTEHGQAARVEEIRAWLKTRPR